LKVDFKTNLTWEKWFLRWCLDALTYYNLTISLVNVGSQTTPSCETMTFSFRIGSLWMLHIKICRDPSCVKYFTMAIIWLWIWLGRLIDFF